MLRISRLTDYATVVLVAMLSNKKDLISASELSDVTDINFPTVSKILKILYKAKIVESVRGINGGYKLIKNGMDISVAEIIDAIEGPIAITDCSSHKCHCKHESHCSTGLAWQDINESIRSLLTNIPLADMQDNKNKNILPAQFAGMPINIEHQVK